MGSNYATLRHCPHSACAVIAFSTMALLMRTSSAAENTAEAKAAEISGASETFIVGNVTFALLHEFGHAIIRDFDVPLLGLEEESADTIAAEALIRLDAQHPDAGFGEMLGVTALAQGYVWKTGLERDGAQIALWAQHGLSAQRFARIVCLLYGSDPKRNGWLVEAVDMEEIRAENCEDEWNIAERGVRWVRDTYGISRSQRSSRPSAEITIKYAQPLNANEARLAELIQGRQLLEKLGQQVQSAFAFPEPLTLKLSRCGGPNAYWDDEHREVVLCYELIEAFAKYSQHPEVAKVVERFRTRERRKTAHAVSTGERRMMLIAHQGNSSEEDSRLRTKEIPA